MPETPPHARSWPPRRSNKPRSIAPEQPGSPSARCSNDPGDGLAALARPGRVIIGPRAEGFLDCQLAIEPLGPILGEPHSLTIQHRTRRSGVPWSGALRSKSAALTLPHSQIRFLTLRGCRRPFALQREQPAISERDWFGQPLRKGRLLSISLATPACLNFRPLRPGGAAFCAADQISCRTRAAPTAATKTPPTRGDQTRPRGPRRISRPCTAPGRTVPDFLGLSTMCVGSATTLAPLSTTNFAVSSSAG